MGVLYMPCGGVTPPSCGEVRQQAGSVLDKSCDALLGKIMSSPKRPCLPTLVCRPDASAHAGPAPELRPTALVAPVHMGTGPALWSEAPAGWKAGVAALPAAPLPKPPTRAKLGAAPPPLVAK